MQTKDVWTALSAVHPVTARSLVTERPSIAGSPSAIGYTIEKTNTGTGAIRVWCNNRTREDYRRDVEVASGSTEAEKAANNTVGWVILESVPSIAITAANPETKSPEIPAPAKHARYRLEFVSTAGTTVLTARVAAI